MVQLLTSEEDPERGLLPYQTEADGYQLLTSDEQSATEADIDY